MLMIILGKTQNKWIWAEVRSNLVEGEISHHAAALAQMAAAHPDAAGNHFFGDSELPVEFKCSRLHCHGARCLSGARIFLNDAEWNPGLGQPQCQHHSGRASSNDEDLFAHRSLALNCKSTQLLPLPESYASWHGATPVTRQSTSQEKPDTAPR